jgi:mannose-6-phosphate isomerase-like protein (cupin superfamily)
LRRRLASASEKVLSVEHIARGETKEETWVILYGRVDVVVGSRVGTVSNVSFFELSCGESVLSFRR